MARPTATKTVKRKISIPTPDVMRLEAAVPMEHVGYVERSSFERAKETHKAIASDLYQAGRKLRRNLNKMEEVDPLSHEGIALSMDTPGIVEDYLYKYNQYMIFTSRVFKKD